MFLCITISTSQHNHNILSDGPYSHVGLIILLVVPARRTARTRHAALLTAVRLEFPRRRRAQIINVGPERILLEVQSLQLEFREGLGRRRVYRIVEDGERF